MHFWFFGSGRFICKATLHLVRALQPVPCRRGSKFDRGKVRRSHDMQNHMWSGAHLSSASQASVSSNAVRLAGRCRTRTPLTVSGTGQPFREVLAYLKAKKTIYSSVDVIYDPQVRPGYESLANNSEKCIVVGLAGPTFGRYRLSSTRCWHNSSV